MDEQEELLSAVHRLAWADTGELECADAGHPPGHVCLDSSDGNDLALFQEALRRRYGRPRTLAMDGFADPTVGVRTGLPLLAPFGKRIVEMRAWAHAGRWIGCGTVRLGGDGGDGDGDGVRMVALVAERADPAADLAAATSWVDGVVAVTGWDTTRARTVDWTAVEGRIGTALPGEYKRLTELFGHGAFDGYLELRVPDARFDSDDIVPHSEWLGEWARTGSGDIWEPYEVYPVPGGLLEWASSEQADQFYWLTEGPDPDNWPILVKEDIPDSWQRFDETTGEFIYRMLTERQRPFSTARHFDTHWFDSYDSEGRSPGG
ncbi:hypothetical protein [Streptomyces niveus]|uniref:hypothetical protein n=1 Tax=Streptomyces niveus TaxID=193462 RepID=UPI0036860421